MPESRVRGARLRSMLQSAQDSVHLSEQHDNARSHSEIAFGSHKDGGCPESDPVTHTPYVGFVQRRRVVQDDEHPTTGNYPCRRGCSG